MIQIEASAPIWAHKLARDAQTEIDQALSLFVSRSTFTVAGLTTVSASNNTNKIALLSDGTFWLAKSNGVAWIYPDGTPV